MTRDRETTPNPESDSMFGAIVRGANRHHQRQQEEAHRNAGVDPGTGQATSSR